MPAHQTVSQHHAAAAVQGADVRPVGAEGRACWWVPQLGARKERGGRRLEGYLLEHQARSDVVDVNVLDRVPKKLRRRAERRIGQEDQLHVARQKIREALLDLVAGVSLESILFIEGAERRRHRDVDTEAVIEHGLRRSDAHDGALPTKCRHDPEHVVRGHVPAGSSAHAPQIP
jgi:hypothetical protein